MGDARHKRSPPRGKLRTVTSLFVKQVEAELAANDVYNTRHHLRKGDAGYRPRSHQDLADELECTPDAIGDLLGGVRATNKPVGRSRLVDPICELLGLEKFVDVNVPESIADLVQRIAALSPERRAEITEEVRKKK